MNDNDINITASDLCVEFAKNLAELYPNKHELSSAIAATIGIFVLQHEVHPGEITNDIITGIMHLVDQKDIENPFTTTMVHPGVSTIQ